MKQTDAEELGKSWSNKQALGRIGPNNITRVMNAINTRLVEATEIKLREVVNAQAITELCEKAHKHKWSMVIPVVRGNLRGGNPADIIHLMKFHALPLSLLLYDKKCFMY